MARKTMSSLDIYSWTNTTGKSIIGQRIDNAYYEGNFVLFKIKTGISDILLIEPSNRLHFTKRIRPSSEFVDKQFALLLRKYVRDLKIESIEQIGFDRLIKIKYSSGVKLYVELLPKGVSVLTDENDIILGSTKHVKFKDREIKPKINYVFPKIILEKPWEIEYDKILNKISSFKDIARALVIGLNLPGEVAEEVLYLSGIKKEMDPTKINKSDFDSIISNLKILLNNALEGKGYIHFIEETPIQATPFISKGILENGGKVKEYEYFDIALDDYFNMISGEITNTELENEKSKILHSIEENKLLSSKYLEEAEKLEKNAQIIAQNYSKFEQIVDCISKNRENCENVVKVDNKEKYALINFNGETIKVYFNESLDKGIIRLYRESGELKSKSKKALNSINDMMKKLNELEEKIAIEKIRNLIKNRKKEWYEKYHWVITRRGFLAIGGKDADQNESIVKKYLRDNYIYLHADIHGSPSVILFNDNGDVQESDIEDAAILAVAYSKAWKVGMGSVDVYWVYGNQVSKSPPSGEYLAKGSFMIYGKKNYLKPYNMELCLGVSFNKENIPLIIVGNEDSVKLRSKVYVKLSPGDLSQQELSEKLKEEFSKRADDNDKVYYKSLDSNEIAQRLPGKSRIIYVRKGEGKGFSELSIINET